MKFCHPAPRAGGTDNGGLRVLKYWMPRAGNAGAEWSGVLLKLMDKTLDKEEKRGMELGILLVEAGGCNGQRK